MIDLYLRARTEAKLAKALPFARTQAGDWVIATDDYALCLIGALEIGPPATFNPDPEATPAEPAVDGWFHAILRCTEAIAALVPAGAIVAPPATPKRRWA